MINAFINIIKQAFPGFPRHYTTALGTIVAIHEAPRAEQIGDRYRPRMAVDVQPLDLADKPEGAVLEGLEVPSLAVGSGGGLFAMPQVGQRVRIAYDYGSPTHPYIAHVLPYMQGVPALQPGEVVIASSGRASLKLTQSGQVEITAPSNVKLRADALDAVVASTVSIDAYRANVNISGKVNSTLGLLEQAINGGRKLTIGADDVKAVIGNCSDAVGGDRSLLTASKIGIVAGKKIAIKSAAKDIMLEAKLGKASVTAMKISIGSTAVELVELLYDLLGILSKEIHPTGVGPSGMPQQAPDYIAKQKLLDIIKD